MDQFDVIFELEKQENTMMMAARAKELIHDGIILDLVLKGLALAAYEVGYEDGR